MGLVLDIPGAGRSVWFNNSEDFRLLQFNTDVALQIFEDKAVITPEVWQNVYGLYTFANVGRDGEARYGSFERPFGILRKRTEGCTKVPKGRTTFKIQTLQTCPIELYQQLCPDAFWNGCWEKLLGIGHGKGDLFGTPEITAVMDAALNETFKSVGDSYYDIIHFGNHPLVDLSDTSNHYQAVGVGEKDWADWKEQQEACTGLLTYMDEAKAEGDNNFNVQITDAEYTGAVYTGDAIALFKRLVGQAKLELRVWGKNKTEMPLIIGVTSSIFDRYKEQLVNQFNQTWQAFYLQTLGPISQQLGISMSRAVLPWDGYMVVCMDSWDRLSHITGMFTHRAAIFAPGVLGIAYDVSPGEQFNGMGLRVTQRLLPPFNGLTWFDTQFRAGAKLIDKKYISYAASDVLLPSEWVNP